MNKQSPSVNYFPKQISSARDASHSKVFLCATNYTQRPLHKRFDTRTACPTAAVASLPVAAPAPEMKSSITNEDIFAPPESSSDEDEAVSHIDQDNVKALNPPSVKRKSIDSIPSRSSKRVQTTYGERTGSEQSTSTVAISSGPDDWLVSSQPGRSQSSQGKKKISYGKQNVSRGPTKPGLTKTGFVQVPEIGADQVMANEKSTSEFVNIEQLQPSPRKTRTRGKATIEIVPTDCEPETKTSVFAMPEEPEDETEYQSDSLNKPKRARSGSSSSSILSDVDSVVSLQLTQSQKDNLQGDNDPSVHAELPPNHVRCPICAHPVNMNTMPNLSTTSSSSLTSKTLNKLPLQQQQNFCHQHQIHDAETEWTARAYPRNIDWTHLETHRIPQHMAQLRKILYRKHPSHYLDILEQKIAEAQGNKTKLKRYLNEGLIDVVKTGYYGPRGAKIMAQVITQHMAKALRMQQKSDKTVMTVGVSGFISAVLLPELAVMIVMQDRKLSSPEEARSLLDESAHVGSLLCPDDDHVERDDLDDP